MKIFNKTVLIFFFCHLFGIGILFGSEGILPVDSAVVAGKIIGYDVNKTSKVIAIIVTDIDGESSTFTTQVSHTGNYKISFPLTFACDIRLSFGNHITMLYVSPAEQTFVDINILRDIDFVIPTESKDTMNKLMLKYSEEFSSYKRYLPTEEIVEAPDSVLIGNRLDLLASELKFIDEFITKNSVNSKQFINWAKNDRIYVAATDILTIPFTSKINRSLKVSKLFSFLKLLNLNVEGSISNSTYYQFVKFLASDIALIVNLNPQYSAAKTVLGNDPFSLFLDETDKQRRLVFVSPIKRSTILKIPVI